MLPTSTSRFAALLRPALLRSAGNPLFWTACPCERASFASSSASRATRKKKNKLKFRHVHVPDRMLRQKDGDFPVQLRPAKLPETRDIQDSTFDQEAAGGYDRAPKKKPHLVREALRVQSPSTAASALNDNLTTAALKKKGLAEPLSIAELPRFNPEKDLKEEDAADLAASRARALARRNYKWMPNPYSASPGPLGSDPTAEAKYYERYFDGRRPAGDRGVEQTPTGAGAGEEFHEESGKPARVRERISPKRFWYQPEYVSPDPHAVAMMNSRELKYAMVNEAHLVRKWKNSQPEGRAAGKPPDSDDLWMAFGYRAAELATGKISTDLKSLTQPSSADSIDGSRSAGAAAKLQQRCSLSTTLRFLQTLASVQAGPFSALQRMVHRVLEHMQDLRPHQCFFLLQAMSRLRLKNPKAVRLLQRMSLAWKTLPDKKFVKAANAVAKLDMGGHLWAKPLKLALARAIPQLSGRHLANLKAVAVMELLDEPAALQIYLQHCERTRTEHWYPRHLQMVELYVHLLHPDVWADLDESIKLFLQEVRTAAEQSRGSQLGPRDAAASAEEPDTSDDDESDTDSSDSDGAVRTSKTGGAGVRVQGQRFDRRKFSSALHADVSRVLGEVIGVDHHSRLAAGPLTVDCCHMPTMTVVEAAARWQFYLHSPYITALARRRQELLRAMGFRFFQVPYHKWDALENDVEKANFLRGMLPPEVLASARPSAAAQGRLE